MKKVQINALNKNFTLPNYKLCDINNIKKCKKAIRKKLPKVISPLPDNYPWKERKELHMKKTEEATYDIINEHFKDKIVEENLRLADFINHFHDIGRYLQGQRKLGILDDKYKDFGNHGEAGVNLLERWQVLDIFSEKVQEMIKYAIGNHSIKDTKPLPDQPSDPDRFKFFYLIVARDMDKYDNLVRQIDQYLHEGEGKERTFELFPQIKRKNGGTISPKIMNNFKNNKLINTDNIRSYEEYILQMLAWVFDVNLQIVLEEIFKSGAVEKMLDYLEEEIDKKEYLQIQETVEKFSKSKNL
ncbi:MAG: hypothetical protein BRC22_03070 [Parcubacteria group bacterium QH_9_35_7]|nr:MAG: hypothetical protein BRC22_03070 [Parcubacteria group bacterium QH_9_35_7]